MTLPIMTPTRIAVAMGDPAGIGPEICLDLLRSQAWKSADSAAVPIVFGDAGVLRRVASKIGMTFVAPIISIADWPARCSQLAEPAVLDFGYIDADKVTLGRVDASCGDAAYRYVIAAIDAGLAGQVDAISTGPLNKEAMHAAGHCFPGHTEIFAERMKADRSCMMLTSAELTCAFVTAHVGYHEVPALLSVARIIDVIELAADAMRRICQREPRLIACGLNPHAGENGLFGN